MSVGWVIHLSRVELESLIKGFVLFFSSMGILVSVLFTFYYKQEVKKLDEQLFTQMRVCSFDLKCPKFQIDFEQIAKQEPYKLYKTPKALKSFYPLSDASYYLAISLENKKYDLLKSKIFTTIVFYYIGVMVVVLLLSLFFAYYSLYPLRQALFLTQEFIKDLLHDFNTPLSSLRINSFMLKSECPNNEKIERFEQAIATIMMLQENLKAYLFEYEQTKQQINLKEFIEQKVALVELNYKDIEFSVDIDSSVNLEINPNAFGRVCENLLTNAAKYNKKNGKVLVKYDTQTNELIFQDTGKGIKNKHLVFERFYKEQERGVGIGLHIVKKLCDELHIAISLESEVGVGTTFKLQLTKG